MTESARPPSTAVDQRGAQGDHRGGHRGTWSWDGFVRGWGGPVLVSGAFILLTAIGLLGDSAAKPSLGPRGWAPGELPWSLNSAQTTGVLFAAYVLGALGVTLGMMRPRPPPRIALFALVAAALVTAPFGSADHTNYAAYGRIALQGGDPWTESPIAWGGGQDPITSAVQPPWQSTPSIYGPVVTMAHLAAAAIGGDNLRQVVWVWQWCVVAAWLGVRWLLRRLFPTEPGRIDVLWTANPLLVGTAVFGAHVDVLATAAGVAALLLARRRGGVAAFAAGLTVGLGVGVKVTAGVVLLAIAVGWWIEQRSARGAGPSAADPAAALCAPRIRGAGPGTGTFLGRVGWLTIGVATVVIPAQLWAGPHTYEQLAQSRRSISLATPWRKVYEWSRGAAPDPTIRNLIFVTAALVCVGLAAATWRFVRPRPAADAGVQASTAAIPGAGLDAATGGLVPGAGLDAGSGGLVPGAGTGRLVPGAGTGGLVPGAAAIALTFSLSLAYAVGAPYSLPWYDQLVWALLPGIAGAGAGAARTCLARLQVARAVAMTLAYVPGRVVGMSAGVEALTLGWRRNVAPAVSLAVWLIIAWAAVRSARLRRGSATSDPPGKEAAAEEGALEGAVPVHATATEPGDLTRGIQAPDGSTADTEDPAG